MSVQTNALEFNTNKIVLLSSIGLWLVPIMLLISDYITIVLASIITVAIRDTIILCLLQDLKPFTISPSYTFFIVPLIYIVLLSYERLYTKRLSLWKKLGRLLKISIHATVLIIGILYFTGAAKEASRMAVGLSLFVCCAGLTISRCIIERVLSGLGFWQRPVVIIGAGKTAELLAQAFEAESGMGYKIVGLIEDGVAEGKLLDRYPLLGTFKNLERIVRDSGVQDVIFATPGLERNELLELVYRVQPYAKNILIVPDLFGVPMSNMEVETLFDQKALLLKLRNNLQIKYNIICKQIFDFVFGSIIFVLVSPLLLILALLIKLNSEGPIFHIDERLGKNGKLFSCYKFRTMFLDGDEILSNYLVLNQEASYQWKRYCKLKDFDPRVTKTGRWLRKFSLDELPQIFNVLKGDMSLVGPRPYLPREQKQMGIHTGAILETLPGITGLWQVNGRNEIDFQGRLALDSWYVRNWGLGLDLMLLLKTVNVVLSRKGAY